MTGFTVEIDTREAAAQARAWAEAPEIVVEELVAGMREATLLAEREVKENTPLGVGGAAAGLHAPIAAREPQVAGNAVIGVVATSAPHAIPVELGTRPHFPPIQPLEDWARVKLRVPAGEARGVAFAIAHKIAKEGTEGAFMFERGLAASRPQIERIFAARRGRIVERLARRSSTSGGG